MKAVPLRTSSYIRCVLTTEVDHTRASSFFCSHKQRSLLPTAASERRTEDMIQVVLAALDSAELKTGQ